MVNGYGAPDFPAAPANDPPARRLGPVGHFGSPLFGSTLRQPPHNPQAEQALLGALLANNRAYDRVGDFLRPDHFSDAAHGRIYEAIARQVDAGRVADVVTLRTQFEASGDLQNVGGAEYLVELLGAMVSIGNAAEYGRQIVDCWRRRQLIEQGETLVNRCFGSEPDLDAAQIQEEHETALLHLGEGNEEGAVQPASQVAHQVLEQFYGAVQRRGGLAGVSYGLRRLDRMTGGAVGGQLIVLGARPSMGKTALAATIAEGAASSGARVLFVSAEMAAWQVMARMIAHRAGLATTGVLRAGDEDADATWRSFAIDGPEAARVRNAAMEFDLPIEWDDQSRPTVAAIRARARRMKRKGGLDLIIVDYLGMCRCSKAAERQNRTVQVGEMAADFKGMAKALNVPVVLLSQLSRANESREDRRPQLSDLRDSGEIEAHADTVAFLHREDYYLRRNKPQKRAKEGEADFQARIDDWYAQLNRFRGVAELNIAKQRQGPVGVVELWYDERTTWFTDTKAE